MGLCSACSPDDIDDDDAWYQSRIGLGIVLFLLTCGTVSALVVASDVMYEWREHREFVVQQPVYSGARVIPQ